MSDWDAKLLGGSIKRGIVNPDLQKERDTCAFDKLELEKFIWSEELHAYIKKKNDMFQEDQNLHLPRDVHELSREELMKEWWRIYHYLMQKEGGKWFRDNLTMYDEHSY